MCSSDLDAETAEIAIQAALTGHLVFSTLHTNDAAGAVSRLLEMGVEDYLLASSLLGVLAQRLVRRMCTKCRRPAEMAAEVLRDIGGDGGTQVFEGQGCEDCAHTGYRGRLGIFELLLVNDVIRPLILERSSADIIKDAGVAAGDEDAARRRLGEGSHRRHHGRRSGARHAGGGL